jgi:hypothetical protein
MSAEIKRLMWGSAAAVLLLAVPYILLSTDIPQSLTGQGENSTAFNVGGTIVSAILGLSCLAASVEAGKKPA